MFSLNDVILVNSRLGFEGGVWLVIAPLSGDCLFVAFTSPNTVEGGPMA